MRVYTPRLRRAQPNTVSLMLAAALGVAACSPTGQPARGAATGHPTSTAARSGRTMAATRLASVTIAAVGDTMLGSTPDLPPDPGKYLAAVDRKLTRGAQIVFGNLEGTLTTATASKCAAMHAPAGDCFAFRDPPGYVRFLKRAGFTILSDANPHSFDFGAAGQAQTVRTIHKARLAQTGLPGEITLVQAHGVRVAFLSFAPYADTASLLDLPAARGLIKRSARQASVVVVYMHAGAEGSTADHVTGHEEYFLGEDRGNPEAFAHMAIRAGASLVIASGPHVIRGMQFYRRHLIAYSLGNFASYNNFATDGNLDISVILHVTLSATGAFEHARIYPIQFTGQGRPVSGGSAISFVSQLSAQDFGASAARIRRSGIIKAP
ncbi:MAG TPA: CapA family protein [Streptosporangiaceae bacterium]|nr:CapA family protein [Streptosporangiaceae bacterium]